MGMSHVEPPTQLSREVSTPVLGSVAYNQTELGLLPGDWEVVLLESTAKRGSGHTPDKKHLEYWNGTIKWVSLADSDRLDNVFISETATKITPAGLANSSAVLHPPGTVILSRDAGVGKSAILADEMAVSQHFMAWLCGQRLHNLYLYYWLQSQKSEFERIAIGNTIKTIGLPFFKNLKIPLPSLLEQWAIATALSDIDELISALDKIIGKKRALKLATMQQLLTGKTRLPGYTASWETKPLHQLMRFIPTANNTWKDLGSEGDVQYIHYGDVHRHSRPILDCRTTPLPRIAGTKVSRIERLRHGDLVLADASEDYEGIGKSVEVEVSAGQEVVAGLHTIVCRGLNEEWAFGFKGYLQFIPAFKNALIRFATGISVYGISKKHLGDVSLPLPERAEQEAIASILRDMDAEMAALECRRDKAKAIKQGMMQALLTGRIRLVRSEVAA